MQPQKTGVPTSKLGMRGKLVLLFVLIKVLPLILLALLAWTQASQLGTMLGIHFKDLTLSSQKTLTDTLDFAIDESAKALDQRARDDIERLTTDTADAIARFLLSRDSDILLAANIPTDQKSYQTFISKLNAPLPPATRWALSEDQSHWQQLDSSLPMEPASFSVRENAKAFHYRAPDQSHYPQLKPLYLEMTFVDLEGNERYKATTSPLMNKTLQDISKPENTFIKAEHYFDQLKKLKAGDIYVSEVIGAYVPSRVIGHYTPKSTAKAGVEFQPEQSAYAGVENPLGKKFQGIIRWATPVQEQGKTIGYVTLALNHDHIMAFTDRITPTPKRYINTPDASDGNYAFIWDYLGRSIAHPRHYFIAGYDPKTGEPTPPWLEEEIYKDWQASGLSYVEYSKTAPTYRDQGLHRKPATELTKSGNLGLDCRYLNFAPQCAGWFDLTKQGGSGSFVILWSGIWKLTTAAAIPYYTGRYAENSRGFGFVTIGANVDEFHRPAVTTKEQISQQIEKSEEQMIQRANEADDKITDNLASTAMSLLISTIVMIVIVILIAIWIASLLTQRITTIIAGLTKFQEGERSFRFNSTDRDEIGALSNAFDGMANQIDKNLTLLEDEIKHRESTEHKLLQIQEHLEELVQSRTTALQTANLSLKAEVTERLHAEKTARHLAEHDPLTGLANRLRFHQRLTLTLKNAAKYKTQVAVLFFDLDRFKDVNDTLGHSIGDQLLCQVSSLLQKHIRNIDTVARLGGDEFAIILADLEDSAVASRVASNIVNALMQPFTLADQTVMTGTSIGITIYPDDATQPEQLILNADLAMYQAKSAGGNCFKFFHSEMHDSVVQRRQLEIELKHALENSQFCLHYQPRFNFRNNSIVGVEALIRWNHPTRGLLAPIAFLETAENCGMMAAMDLWVLQQACHTAAQWLDDGLEFGRIAINASVNELAQPDFCQQIFNALKLSGLPANRLEIEITERALIRHYEAVVKHLVELQSANIKIAIDDFGIEHSSLQRLIECPIDVIKIDRFFVKRIGEGKSDAVIEAILAMARSTDMEIIAEGVETTSQLNFLRSLDCHTIQGYLHARPMPSEMFQIHLQSYKQKSRTD